MSDQVHRDSVAYWKNVTDENRAIDKNHPSPRRDIFETYFDLLPLPRGGRVLDLGIGFGRFIPVYQARGLEIHGIDIDQKMLDDLAETAGDAVTCLKQGDASNIEYDDSFFDAVVCWGVFDELDQASALIEISRILKVGGHCLLTGKNTRYFADDSQAMAAEKGARAKRHPNHFTDLENLPFSDFGFELIGCGCFARRGDMSLGQPLENGYDLARPFYEYILRLRKSGNARFSAAEAPEIAFSHSKTFLELEGNEE